MNVKHTWEFVERTWRASVLPALQEFIGIPNQSPAFDPDWQAHGHMERAVALVVRWIEQQQVPGLMLEVVRLPGRTPLLLLEMAGDPAAPDTGGTVLLY